MDWIRSVTRFENANVSNLRSNQSKNGNTGIYCHSQAKKLFVVPESHHDDPLAGTVLNQFLAPTVLRRGEDDIERENGGDRT